MGGGKQIFSRKFYFSLTPTPPSSLLIKILYTRLDKSINPEFLIKILLIVRRHLQVSLKILISTFVLDQLFITTKQPNQAISRIISILWYCLCQLVVFIKLCQKMKFIETLSGDVVENCCCQLFAVSDWFKSFSVFSVQGRGTGGQGWVYQYHSW